MLLDSLGLNKALGTLQDMLCWVLKYLFLMPSFLPPNLSWKIGSTISPQVYSGKSFHLPNICAIFTFPVSLLIIRPCLLWIALERLWISYFSLNSLFRCVLQADNQARRRIPKIFLLLTTYLDILLTETWWLTAMHTVG